MKNMILIAMGVGPPAEWLIAITFFAFCVFVILCVLIIRYSNKKISLWRAVGLTFLYPIILIGIMSLTYYAHDFFTSPMTVDKGDLSGSFVINRDYFEGEEADWQYDHYWINIEEDKLFLHVMDDGIEIKEYQIPIILESPYLRGRSKRKHTFFRFYSRYSYNRQDTTLHHMLNKNPKLLANPFSFNIILVSEKYGNMFFTKGTWKPR